MSHVATFAAESQLSIQLSLERLFHHVGAFRDRVAEVAASATRLKYGLTCSLVFGSNFMHDRSNHEPLSKHILRVWADWSANVEWLSCE